MAISRSKRDIGLDLTRIIAFIQVPCIHFLFKIKYYNQAIIGERMYLMTFIRVMFMTCVPLFLLLNRLSQLGKEGRNCAEASSEILLASCSDTSDLRHNRRYHNRVRHFRKRRDRDHRLRYPQCSRFPKIFVVHRNVYRACAHDPVS